MLRRAAAARPQDELTWRALGQVLRTQGDLVRAEQALRRVDDLNPRMAVFFVERAELLVALGRAAEVDDVTADALAALPHDAALRTELARVHANAGGLLRAREPLQETLRIESANATAKALLAQVEADAARTR